LPLRPLRSPDQNDNLFENRSRRSLLPGESIFLLPNTLLHKNSRRQQAGSEKAAAGCAQSKDFVLKIVAGLWV
jgi:hypothetical protein